MCYVILGAPLFFQQDLVARYNIPVRTTPNIAHYNYLPHKDGVNGTWIRPEDVSAYEPTITTIEFEGLERQEQEQALYRIYAKDKAWPGKLDMIVQNLGAAPTNRMIPEDLAQIRRNCGQKCAALGTCQICYRYFSLADPEKLRPYMDKTIH